MKRKLKLDDLAVASFSTEQPVAGARGTVRAASGYTQCYETLIIPESCVYACPVGTRDTCYDTCGGVTCESCQPTCVRC